MVKKRCCVFCMVKNEKIFLPIWLKYYSKFFDNEDIYVLDHGSNDGSIEEFHKKYNFNVTQLPWKYFDEIYRLKMVRLKQAELLQLYEYVLFTDADEIVIPNPKKFSGLKEYISKLNKDCIYCTGYCLIHMKNEEPPIDLNRQILEQRGYWYADMMYDKPLLSRIPLEWKVGFHRAINIGGFRDKDLWLLHLHKMDFDLCWLKHQEISGFKWSEECIRNGFGCQFRIKTQRDFTNYFYSKNLRKRRWWFFFIFPVGVIRFLGWAVERLVRAKTFSWRAWSHHYLPTITKIPKILIKSKII